MAIVEKLVIAALVVIYSFFFLSVIAPMHSQHKFWLAIYRVRNAMDVAIYWVYILFAVIIGLCAAWFGVHQVLGIL